MNSLERKKLFIVLLEEMLSGCGGVKIKLAKQLGISGSGLTHWLQGKIDPGELGIKTFTRIADVKGISVDELTDFLGFFEESTEPSLEKFRQILQELLENNSQDKLAEITGISQGTISKWLDPNRQFDLDNVSAMRIAAIAKQKKWSVEKLLIYLNLKKNKEIIPFYLKSEAANLSLSEQINLLIWLSNFVEQKLKEAEKTIRISKTLSDTITVDDLPQRELAYPGLTLLIILDKEDLAIATSYASNLAIHLQLQPDDIQVTTIPKLPQSLDNIDVLIFDISTADSPSIALIEDISFDGDIVVFADPDLSQETLDRISNRITEVLLKPIDWNELKTKTYFS